MSDHAIQQRFAFCESGTCGRTIRLRSFTGDQWYNISLDDKTCDCLGFTPARGCEHLNALGIHRLRPFTPTTHPTFSQALSGLVKSLRIRRPEEAAYWLHYLHRISQDQQQRFRVARRLLQGTAEDGLSILVMEKCVSSFRMLQKKDIDLAYWVAEALRICNVPNWWDSSTGGHDYIYTSLVGWRAMFYEHDWDRQTETVKQRLEEAVETKDKIGVAKWICGFDKCKNDKAGTSKQAEFILELAKKYSSDYAGRLMEVHLSQRSALSVDNNFICQALWYLAGGQCSVAEKIEQVTKGECRELIEKVTDRWKNPQPIPGWCCDGIHSAGNDARFAGILPQMYAVCKAFEHYGRVDPTDEWLPEFQCYDGLTIEKEDKTE